MNFLTLIPWRRVATIAASAFGAYQALPADQQSNPRVLAALAISSLAGVAVNGERLMRKKPKAFDVEAARKQVDKL